MKTVSISYTPKYELSFASNYCWTECGKCFNIKTGREIKKVYNKGSIGYSINGRFKSLKSLRKNIVKIKKDFCPF